jgi:hypothetical protein
MIQCLGLALKHFSKRQRKEMINDANVVKSLLGGGVLGCSFYLSFILCENIHNKKKKRKNSGRVLEFT